MSNNKKFNQWLEDWIPIILFLFFVALGVGVVVLVARYLLAPFLTELNTYLSNYGRMTAEVFSLVMVVGFGLRFHEKIVNELIEKFDNLSNNQEVRLKECEKRKLEVYAELQGVKSKLQDQQRGDSFLKERIRELIEQIVSLESEIERLKNPEAAAKKEQAQVQQEANRDLKAIADSIKWGRV